MWVKLRTTLAGPDQSGQPGQIIEVSEATAAELVRAGYAEMVPGTEAKAAPRATETADDPQIGAERAIEPGHGKAGKRGHR